MRQGQRLCVQLQGTPKGSEKALCDTGDRNVPWQFPWHTGICLILSPCLSCPACTWFSACTLQCSSLHSLVLEPAVLSALPALLSAPACTPQCSCLHSSVLLPAFFGAPACSPQCSSLNSSVLLPVVLSAPACSPQCSCLHSGLCLSSGLSLTRRSLGLKFQGTSSNFFSRSQSTAFFRGVLP